MRNLASLRGADSMKQRFACTDRLMSVRERAVWILLAGIFSLDALLPLGVASGALYVLPVLMASRCSRPKAPASDCGCCFRSDRFGILRSGSRRQFNCPSDRAFEPGCGPRCDLERRICRLPRPAARADRFGSRTAPANACRSDTRPHSVCRCNGTNRNGERGSGADVRAGCC